MRISFSPHDNRAHFEPVEINSLREFIEYATKYSYSPFIYKDSRRKGENFQATECIIADIDEDMSIGEAALLFKRYKHLIMPTRSHQKEKNGKVCDRFRVILFLDGTITNEKDYKATWYKLQAMCPALDRQCKDLGRYYFASTSVYSRNDEGELFPIVEAPKTKDNELDLALSDDSGPKGELSKATKKLLVDGARAGERHGELVKAVFDMKEQGYNIDQIKLRVDSMARSGGNWDTPHINDKDIQTIEDVFERPHKYEKRENLTHRESMFNFQKIGDLVAEAGEVEWLCEDLLSKGGFSIMVGPPKAGKSTLVRQLVKSVAQGIPFLGRDITQGSVLYLTFEEQPAILKQQFAAVGISPNDPIFVHCGTVFGETALDDIKDAITQFQPRLVVLDTLFDVSQLESINDYKEVKHALALLRNVARTTDAHILGVHHTNKGGSGNGSIMGSNAIHGAVDTLIRFCPTTKKRFLNSNGKYGNHFTEQEIIFDKTTESYSLGEVRED